VQPDNAQPGANEPIVFITIPQVPGYPAPETQNANGVKRHGAAGFQDQGFSGPEKKGVFGQTTFDELADVLANSLDSIDFKILKS
jgi:hypothetical protein